MALANPSTPVPLIRNKTVYSAILCVAKGIPEWGLSAGKTVLPASEMMAHTAESLIHTAEVLGTLTSVTIVKSMADFGIQFVAKTSTMSVVASVRQIANMA